MTAKELNKEVNHIQVILGELKVAKLKADIELIEATDDHDTAFWAKQAATANTWEAEEDLEEAKEELTKASSDLAYIEINIANYEAQLKDLEKTINQ